MKYKPWEVPSRWSFPAHSQCWLYCNFQPQITHPILQNWETNIFFLHILEKYTVVFFCFFLNRWKPDSVWVLYEGQLTFAEVKVQIGLYILTVCWLYSQSLQEASALQNSKKWKVRRKKKCACSLFQRGRPYLCSQLLSIWSQWSRGNEGKS